MSIAVIGTGYVGLVAAVCLANSGKQVVAVEKSVEKLAKLREGIMPIYEEGLEELFHGVVAAGRLTFTDDLAAALQVSQTVLIAVGTPSLPDGRCDLSQVQAVAQTLATQAPHPLVVVMKSTVPPGTGRMLVERYFAQAVQPISYCSNPEFLREGRAVWDWYNPDRIVFGASDEAAVGALHALYDDIDRPKVVMDVTSAEMVKYTSNAFLAVKISFINEIANLCEQVGADIDLVAPAVGMDDRIGPKFLNAGIGYGGSCFPKDTLGLNYVATANGLHATILRAVMDVNERQRVIAVNKVLRALGNPVGKKVAVLGLAFKPGTDDIREAPALSIIEQLLAAGAEVAAADPMAVPHASHLHSLRDVRLTTDPYEAAHGAHAVLLTTEWPEFVNLDWHRLREGVEHPYVLDGRNSLDKQALLATGWQYEGMGR